MVLVLWHEESDEDIHVKERDHEGRLRVRTIHEPVDILDLQDGGARASRKHRDAAFEPNIGLGDAAKQGLYKLIDFLACLAR